MLLHHVTFLDFVLSFKAPRNHMYLVESIHMMLHGDQANNAIRLYSRQLATNVDFFTGISEVFASFSSETVGNFQISGINEKMKHISIAKTTAMGVVAEISIYGELIKASRTELIVEWFRKR